MTDKTVDVFIPIIAGNMRKAPAALYSAITQTYEDVRIVLFFDQDHYTLEDFLDKWWYTHEDKPRQNLIVRPHKAVEKPITLEYCKRGVVVRNPNGPMGSAGFARQWVFEWEGGAPYMKFLDSDDILGPDCLSLMMRYMSPECSGVTCPVYFIAGNRFGHIKTGALEHGQVGSGSFLIKRETMKHMIDHGMVWMRQPGHDKSLVDFCIDNKYPFISMNMVNHNFTYMYLKD